MSDINYMRHAITIAARAIGTTAPNPSVGCVIVQNKQIIAAAHTGRGGRPHAETIALNQAGKSAFGATAYVTLEPCSHVGQTPPCAEALIKAGIKRVVIANIDPFIKVNGSGIKMLQNAGIEVVTGVCTNEAATLTAGFFSVIQKSRPFITLKTATSLDGKIALKPGITTLITNEESRAYMHLMRAKNDAILTGIGTILADNPALTCRLNGMQDRSPIRIILDTNLRLPIDYSISQTAKQVPVWLVTTSMAIKNQQNKAQALEKAGIKLIAAQEAGGKICLKTIVTKFAEQGITSIMVEAGSNINTSLLQLGLIDQLAWFTAPVIFGATAVPAFATTHIHNFQPTYCRHFGDDIFRLYKPK